MQSSYSPLSAYSMRFSLVTPVPVMVAVMVAVAVAFTAPDSMARPATVEVSLVHKNPHFSVVVTAGSVSREILEESRRCGVMVSLVTTMRPSSWMQ